MSWVTQRWIAYQLDKLERKTFKAGQEIDQEMCCLRYAVFFKNLESVRDQMQQHDDILKAMFEWHKEYNSVLQHDAQETDEEWFDDVEHNLCAFKQKIHYWMKYVEAERKATVSSRLSDVSVGRASVRSIKNIHQDQAANNQQTQVTNLQEKTGHLRKKSRWQN